MTTVYSPEEYRTAVAFFIMRDATLITTPGSAYINMTHNGVMYEYMEGRKLWLLYSATPPRSGKSTYGRPIQHHPYPMFIWDAYTAWRTTVGLLEIDNGNA